MENRLSLKCDASTMTKTCQYLGVFDAVCTGGVSGIHAGEVRRLDATGPQVAVAQYAVAVRPRHPLAPPCPHRRVPIPQARLTPS